MMNQYIQFHLFKIQFLMEFLLLNQEEEFLLWEHPYSDNKDLFAFDLKFDK